MKGPCHETLLIAAFACTVSGCASHAPPVPANAALCSAEAGFDLGYRGLPARRNCPASALDTHHAGHRQGFAVHQLVVQQQRTNDSAIEVR